MKLTQNFHLEEFVSPYIFNKYGRKSIRFLDPRIPFIVQKIRDIYGKPIWVNTWKMGGRLKDSGFRDHLTSIGATYSQHKFGRAADLHAEDLKAVWDIVIKEGKDMGITRMESTRYTPNWCHIDVATTNSQDLSIFKPKRIQAKVQEHILW